MELDLPGYDIIERIGAGGMASVYRANQHTFQRDVALKVLRQDLGEDQKFSERFIQESLIVAKLHHSHIVQVYDVGEYKQMFYVAMEFLSNGNLSESMRAKKLSTAKAVEIFSQIASALDYSHQKGIVHRDVKPDNIMFREDGAAVLTDFGIAKDTDATMDLTQTGTILGTPKYMSPEQIRGATVGSVSDLYSLGIVFYQMLTGFVPYTGATMVEVAFKHLNDPIPTLPEHLARYQPIIDKTMAKKPGDRFARGKDIIQALNAINHTQAIPPQDDDQDQTVIMDESFDTSAEASAPANSDDDATVISQESPPASFTHTPASNSSASAAPVNSTPANGTPMVDAQAETVVLPSSPRPAHSNQSNKAWPIAAGAVALVAVIAIVLAITSGKQDAPEPIASASEPTSTAADSKDPKVIASRVNQLLASARLDESNSRLTKPDGNNAFSKYQQVLRQQPDNQEAQSGIARIADYFVTKAEQLPSNQNLEKANDIVTQALSASDQNSFLSAITERLQVVSDSSQANSRHANTLFVELQVQGLLRSAEIDEREGRIAAPADNNAIEKYRKVLDLDPQNSQATARLAALEK